MSKVPKDLLTEINKRWPGSAKLGNDPSLQVTRIPTGILSVDFLLGGGIARGRHIEVFGSYAVGKSTLACMCMAQAQQMGELACYVDTEKSWDPKFARHLGVDVDSLVYHRQVSGNQAVDFMDTLLRSERFAVIVLDSISALIPKAELESDMEAGSMGMEQAKLMSKALRKLTVANQKTALIYINQQRQSVGKVFGPKWTTSGGVAMSFYASTRLELIRTETIKKKTKVVDHAKGDLKDQDVPIGHRVLVRVEKNKSGHAMAGQTTTFVFSYETGSVDRTEDLMYLGRQLGLITKKANTWAIPSISDDQWVGRPRFKAMLKKDRGISGELEETIRGRFGEQNIGTNSEDDEE